MSSRGPINGGFRQVSLFYEYSLLSLPEPPARWHPHLSSLLVPLLVSIQILQPASPTDTGITN